MNFKLTGLFILLFSIVGMSSAATISIQHLGNPTFPLMISGVGQNGTITPLVYFLSWKDQYTHTGEYNDLRLTIGYGRCERGVDMYIKNLNNANTYPSDQQLNVSLRDLYGKDKDIEKAPDYQGNLSWSTGRGYGILGLDNKLHQPDYCLPPYQQQ